MKRNILLIILVITVFYSCNTKSTPENTKGDQYTINGIIENVKGAQYNGYIYLGYGEVLDSVKVENEKFTFTGSLDKATQGWVHLKLPYVSEYVFLENSDITIEGRFYTYESGGENYNIYQVDTVLGSPSHTLKIGFDRFKTENYKKENYQKLLFDSLKTVIKNYPSSPVSGRILSDIAIPSKKALNYDQINELYNLLDKEKQNESEIEVIEGGLAALKFNTIGNTFPSFSLPNKKDELIKHSDVLHKVTYVDFWASWCTPCIKKQPKMKDLLEKNKNKDFQILSISIDEDKESWIKFLDKKNLPWVQLHDNNHELQNKLGINAIPFNYILDEKGTVIAINQSIEEIQEIINLNK